MVALIINADIEYFLQHKSFVFKASLDIIETYQDEDAGFVIILTLIDYEPKTNVFNTRSVEAVMRR